jgi:hypothetical protein
LRYADIAPLDYRCTTEDVRIDGIIIPNIVTEVMKGSYWKDGDTFNPSRFLDGSKLSPPDERLIPYLFLYFTRILQLFHLRTEVGGVLPEDTFVPGITSSPRPFKIRFFPRKVKQENIKCDKE